MLLSFILRNPFYAAILKKRILEPFIDTIFVFEKIRKIIKPLLFYLIELRCSLAL